MTLRGGDPRVSGEGGHGGGVYSGAAPFRPAWWLPGPHAQSVWGRVSRAGRRLLPFRREALATPDGDELLLDRLDGPAGAPILIVLHGLEGSSFSVYVQGLLRRARARGWRGAAMNFRSCARDPLRPRRSVPNRQPRLYHSGETSDFGFLVATLAAREPGVPLLAAGVSLGGNVLLKWLGENPGQTAVRGAAAISTPYDLASGARKLERGIGRIYTASLLASLREKALDAARRFPDAAARIDVDRTRRSRTFWEFDDAATAPLHGFAGADDYYARASSAGYVAAIATPTLCVSALDDPFLPAEAVEGARRAASSTVRFAVTDRGGHVGFVAGFAPWSSSAWAEETAVAWLGDVIRGRE
ncbi:MAG TPA: alpha/beta fold hydrolase [Thermoanaerobaculia bacterium]|nr:alpha/beta fold hydrolase [Thermoanaerobaculia bacterium]